MFTNYSAWIINTKSDWNNPKVGFMNAIFDVAGNLDLEDEVSLSFLSNQST
jgi:hypothetical protein